MCLSLDVVYADFAMTVKLQGCSRGLCQQRVVQHGTGFTFVKLDRKSPDVILIRAIACENKVQKVTHRI
jgi:hypothetical protein